MPAFSLYAAIVFFLFSLGLKAQETPSTDTTRKLSPAEQQRLYYESQLHVREQERLEAKSQRKKSPSRFFISFGGGVKSYVGAYDRLDMQFYNAMWSPFIQQHLAYRFKFQQGVERPRGNAAGVYYRYSRLSPVFANRFMKEQFPVASPVFSGKMTSLDVGGFLMAGEKLGLSLSKGYNQLERQGLPDYINRYWTLGVLFAYRIWVFENEIALSSMFNKHTVHPCLSVDISLRYKLGFIRYRR